MHKLRKIRETIIATTFAAIWFSYRQFVLGEYQLVVAGLAFIIPLVVLYRHVDARVLEAAAEATDGDEITTALRRLWRWLH